jgi:hypothetical protein
MPPPACAEVAVDQLVSAVALELASRPAVIATAVTAASGAAKRARDRESRVKTRRFRLVMILLKGELVVAECAPSPKWNRHHAQLTGKVNLRESRVVAESLPRCCFIVHNLC